MPSWYTEELPEGVVGNQSVEWRMADSPTDLRSSTTHRVFTSFSMRVAIGVLAGGQADVLKPGAVALVNKQAQIFNFPQHHSTRR